MATTIQLPASFDLDEYTVQIKDDSKIIIGTCMNQLWSEQEHDLVSGGAVRVFFENGHFKIDTESIDGTPEEVKLRVYSGQPKVKFLLTKIDDVHTVELIGADDWRYICNLSNIDLKEHHRFTLNKVSVKVERRVIDGKNHLVLIYDPEDLSGAGANGYITLKEIGKP